MCVYMCISVCIHVCECLPNGGDQSTSMLSVITQVQNKTHTVLAIADFFLVTCLQLTQCDVTVCTYNVLFIYIELRSKNMAHISLHITIAMHMEGMPPQQKICSEIAS